MTRQEYSAPIGSPDDSGVAANCVNVSGGMSPLPRVAISTGNGEGVMLGVSVDVGRGVMVGKNVDVNAIVRVGRIGSVHVAMTVGVISSICKGAGRENSGAGAAAVGAAPGTGIVSTQADDTRMASKALQVIRLLGFIRLEYSDLLVDVNCNG